VNVLPPPMTYLAFVRNVKYRNCIGQFFKRYDADGDGKMTVQEATPFLAHVGKKPAEIPAIFADADDWSDGFMDVHEWYHMLKQFVSIPDEALDKMNEDGTTPPPAETAKKPKEEKEPHTVWM